MGKSTHDTHSEIVEQHLPCEDCGSSDALCVYDDGHTFCFSCEAYSRGDGDPKASGKSTSSHKSKDLLSGDIHAISARGITKETCHKWGVEYVTLSGGEKALAFPYYDTNKRKIAQKLRTADKKFKFIGQTKDPQLFGRQLWSSGKKIVITEGEIDALTVSQVQNHKWPVVSLPNGASSAKKSISTNLRWLEESFEEIILMFDMDEPGQKAAQEVAKLFAPGKCKIANLPYKDANECLLEGKPSDITSAIWGADPYRPDGIVSVNDVIDRIDQKPEYGLPLPWTRLWELTYGLKSSQVWVWTSGSGMGKTEFFKDMAAHLIKDKRRVGLIFLEEEAQDTVVDIAGKMVGKCFNSPDIEYNKGERDAAIQDLQDSNCLFMYDHFGHDDYDAIRAVVRHMVVGHGCEVIFLDHITAFTDGLPTSESNSLMERLMKELASMTRELKFNLQVVSHIRKSDNSRKPAEEGGRVKIDDMKGSGAVKQWANFVIALERNQQAEDQDEARTTTVRILKARGVGKNNGQIVKVKYLPETAQLIQSDEEYLDDLPEFAQ